jgi:hypothetical protein
MLRAGIGPFSGTQNWFGIVETSFPQWPRPGGRELVVRGLGNHVAHVMGLSHSDMLQDRNPSSEREPTLDREYGSTPDTTLPATRPAGTVQHIGARLLQQLRI